MLVLFFVALWFILRGDLLYVFPFVILLLCFSVLLVLRLPRLGKRELILVLFVRLFDLCLFGFVGFLFLLGSGKGFVNVALPGLFSYPFFLVNLDGFSLNLVYAMVWFGIVRWQISSILTELSDRGMIMAVYYRFTFLFFSYNIYKGCV